MYIYGVLFMAVLLGLAQLSIYLAEEKLLQRNAVAIFKTPQAK